jgi:hypothetical protein
MPVGVGKALPRGDIEGPEVPWAADEFALDGTFADWSSPMGAFVIDGIDGILHFEEGDEFAAGLYHFAVAAGNFLQRSDFDPLLCHTSLLKEQPRVMTPSPQAKALI